MSKHREAYEALLCRIAALPKSHGALKSSLEDFAKICDPLDRPIRSHLEARMQIGKIDNRMDARIVNVDYEEQVPRLDSSGRFIYDTSPTIINLASTIIHSNGTVLDHETIYVDLFRNASANWRKDGWWGVGIDLIGFKSYNPVSDDCIVNRLEQHEIRELNPEKVYFLFNCFHSYNNFGHFIHDTMAQLWAYDKMSKILGGKLTPILTSPIGERKEPFQYPIQKYIFERLICPIDQVEFINCGALRAKHCYSTTQMLRGSSEQEISFGAFTYLQKKLSEIALDVTEDEILTDENIYVSRSDSHNKNRQFFNLEEFELTLSQNGFSAVTLSNLAPEKILSLFSGAKKICGIHGAGLLNALFSNEKVTIFELLDYPDSWDSIQRVSTAVGFRHFRIPAIAPTEISRWLPSIDVNSVLDII